MPEARGRGIATRALGLVTRHALDDLGLERVELRIGTDNGASMRVAERYPFASSYRRATSGQLTTFHQAAR